MEVDEWLSQAGNLDDSSASYSSTQIHNRVASFEENDAKRAGGVVPNGGVEEDLESKVLRDIMQATAMLERPTSSLRGKFIFLCAFCLVVPLKLPSPLSHFLNLFFTHSFQLPRQLPPSQTPRHRFQRREEKKFCLSWRVSVLRGGGM